MDLKIVMMSFRLDETTARRTQSDPFYFFNIALNFGSTLKLVESIFLITLRYK